VRLPDGWTCPLAFFGADDGCDCGCGAEDPDCGADGADACDFNHCFDAPEVAVDPCDRTGCATEAAASAEGSCPVGEGEGEGEGEPRLPSCAAVDTGGTGAGGRAAAVAVAGLVLTLARAARR
jgi:hypothetical protein